MCLEVNNNSNEHNQGKEMNKVASALYITANV